MGRRSSQDEKGTSVMSRLFGWSLPPGCSKLPGEEDEGPCDVCKKAVDDCICDECPTCGTNGDPKCYHEHGLRLTREQVVSRLEAEEYELNERLLEVRAVLRSTREGGEFFDELPRSG